MRLMLVDLVFWRPAAFSGLIGAGLRRPLPLPILHSMFEFGETLVGVRFARLLRLVCCIGSLACLPSTFKALWCTDRQWHAVAPAAAAAFHRGPYEPFALFYAINIETKMITYHRICK